MAARLELLGADGQTIGEADAGSVAPGAVGVPWRLTLRNAGDEAIYFTRVRAVPHPSGQLGAHTDTWAATTFALTEDGAYERELELGTLAPGAQRAFWVRWTVPRGTAPGPAAWGLEALGAT